MKTARSIFLPSFLTLLLVTLILIPLQVVFSRAIPFIFIPDQAQRPSIPFYTNDAHLFVARGSPPPVPTGVSASKGDFTDRIRVSWDSAVFDYQVFLPLVFAIGDSPADPIPNVTDFQIFRNTTDTTKGAIQLTDHHPASPYIDTTAEPGVTYYYWVKACNSAGCSDFSASDCGYRASEIAIPSPPTGVSASDGTFTDMVQVSWEASADATYFQVFRHTSNDSASPFTLTSSHPFSPYNDTSAGPETTYYYWVKACNSAGCSDFSTSDCGYRASEIAIPSPPTSVSASDGTFTDMVEISWTVSADATYYQVFRHTSSDSASPFKLTSSHPFSPYNDTSAVPETTYYYWVKACNPAGCSTYSTPDMGWRSLVNIANGDFEAGNDGSWTVYSKLVRSLILHADFTTIKPHSGDYLAWLGGEDGETARLTQSVTIPPSHPYIHFWYIIDSSDTCDNDYARVKINGGTFTVLDLCSPRNTDGWASTVLNLSVYAGETVTLQFEVTTDTSYVSNFYLDDVLFSSTDIAEP
jgi:hypothetical protein